MNKEIIKVPTGIKFVSDWKDYEYPKGHCIVDKGVTGCGYTEYCLRNNLNVVLCSPRKMLLENKSEQHQNDENVLYLKNDVNGFGDLDKLNNMIGNHIGLCLSKGKPIKFMVTYDSAHYLVDYIKKIGQLDKFMFVADEFQSIFLDSYFKAEVENNFVESVQDCLNVVYLSATPMLDKYLEMLDEFKDLKYYSLDWSDTGFVETLQIQRRQTNSLGAELGKIIDDYLSDNYPISVMSDGSIVKSKEAVFYMNSVSEIVKIIKNKNLKPEQVNVLCADTPENRNKLKKIKYSIGKIPLEGEPNKMFTFCTSTCYIGADFYSDNASTYIFADPNLKWLALDISLDLPQIAGRQRDRNNPFKNNIIIFYKLLRKENLEDRSKFDELQNERRRTTKLLIDEYNSMSSEEAKIKIVKKYKSDIKVSMYSDDFISISNTGKLVYNKLIEIADERAWVVSQKDYQDTINVTKAMASIDNVENIDTYKNRDDGIIQEFLDKFYGTNKFPEKLKHYCEFMDEYKNNAYINQVVSYKIPDVRFRNFYLYFGTSKCRAFEFRESNLQGALKGDLLKDNLSTTIYQRFQVGKKYLKKDIKNIIKQIYFATGINIEEKFDSDGSILTKEKINKTPKATDIEEWFEVRSYQTTKNNKRVHGYELISIKKQQ